MTWLGSRNDRRHCHRVPIPACRGACVVDDPCERTVSRNGTLLPIPEGDPRFQQLIVAGLDAVARHRWPRSSWLRLFEGLLSEHYPSSSSADRKLTARHYAPFPLALGPNVP